MPHTASPPTPHCETQTQNVATLGTAMPPPADAVLNPEDKGYDEDIQVNI
jgi:hypothetical protein